MPGTHACLAVTACLAFFPGPAPAQPAKASAPQPAPRLDRYGDPLPPGAVARLGTVRLVGENVDGPLAFSPDGKLLASGSLSRTIHLWDVATGKEVRRFQVEEEDGDPRSHHTLSLIFSPNGRLLFSGSERGVHVWDVSTGKVRRPLRRDTVAISGLTCSPDGKMLATAGTDGCVRLWDIASGKEERCLAGHRHGTTVVAFSPDGKRLASSGADDTLRLWDVKGKELAVLNAPLREHARRSIAFSPDGKWIAAGLEEEGLHVWDLATKKEVMRLRVKQGEERPLGHAGPLAFTPDGRLVTGGGDGVVRIWDLARGKEERCFRFGQWPVYSLALSPDGKRLALLGSGRRIHLCDLAMGKDIYDRAGHRSPVELVSFAGNQRLCSVSREDVSSGRACEWDLTTGKILSQHTLWPTSTAAPFVLPLALRGRLLASIECDKGPVVWDVTTNKKVYSLPRFKNGGFPFALSPDGKTAVFCGRDSGGDEWIRVWDLVRNKEVCHVRVPLPILRECVFSPDGKRIASGGAVYDVPSGKELHTLDLGEERVYHLEFSPDGTLLAAAYPETGLRLWDVNSGKELRRFKWRDTDGDLWPFLTYWGIAFAPDGRSLASVGPDGIVWLWELCTGGRRCRFGGHRVVVTCLAWSPNGRLLASGSDDTTLLVWDVTGTAISSGRSAELTREQLASLWDDLASPDAARAYHSMKKLAASPRQATAFLLEQLRAARPAARERTASLLARLDSRQFAERERSMRELERLGLSAEVALLKARADRPSLEVRQRLDRLLERLDGPSKWQALRGLEVLEWLGTPDVRAALRELAEGDDPSTLTRQAKASLARLQRGAGD
jgi:WD40 repeat protein